ncbi:MAG: hypothetical protein KDE47_15115 [Caldilineaceae bacterium]|nr:hypothetical protein [Caldilineaceae bacterium]
MQIQEPSSHSFIVKIWAEEFVPAQHQAVWRGHITHVGSGERRYLQELDKIAEFIKPYMQELTVPPEENA